MALSTKADVIGYVQRRLGAPAVVVELDAVQCSDVVDDAVRLFDRYLYLSLPQGFLDAGSCPSDTCCRCTSCGYWHQYPDGTDCSLEVCPVDGGSMTNMGVNTGTVTINWPDAATGVLRCMCLRPDQYRTTGAMSIFELMFRWYPARVPVAEWYMLRSFYEMYQRARGTDPDYVVDAEARQVHVNCTSGPYDIYVCWALDITLEAILTGSKSRHQSDFLKTCVAYAKERLVPIRGKFGGVPAPGGALTTDADRLASESREDLKEVEAKLVRLSRVRVLPRWG